MFHVQWPVSIIENSSFARNNAHIHPRSDSVESAKNKLNNLLTIDYFAFQLNNEVQIKSGRILHPLFAPGYKRNLNVDAIIE